MLAVFVAKEIIDMILLADKFKTSKELIFAALVLEGWTELCVMKEETMNYEEFRRFCSAFFTLAEIINLLPDAIGEVAKEKLKKVADMITKNADKLQACCVAHGK